jgi:hypothetical protein
VSGGGDVTPDDNTANDLTSINEHVIPIAGHVCQSDEVFNSLSVKFFYNNPNPFNVSIPIGEHNKFTGTNIPENLGQPTIFLPGEHLAVHLTIQPFQGLPAWTLDGTTVQAERPFPLRPCVPLSP